jgi:hypothetical protein
MSETRTVRFDVLYAYAEAHNLDYNELCRTVRDAIGASPLEPLRELADKGALRKAPKANPTNGNK